ncbi:hypothetical protein ACLOJK_032802 [Asimina triloba]
MEVSAMSTSKKMPKGIDATTEDEYASQSKMLQEFTNFSTFDKAWIFKSDKGNSSRAMFSISQPNLIGNKRRKHILSSYISKGNIHSISFDWSPFPVEMTGVSAIIPSPSGLKLFVVKNGENGSATQFEIWGPSQLLKEIVVPQSVHGHVYADGWFQGISWNLDETLVAYVAEEPPATKPTFDDLGYKKGASTCSDKDFGSWKGQGDWEEDWGETYSGKRQPALFVFSIKSGDVRAVEGIDKSLSVGQVVWSPASSEGVQKYLVFVGWTAECGPQKVSRKLGIKYCYNRPCALFAIRHPFQELSNTTEDLAAAMNLTRGISSAYLPRFSSMDAFEQINRSNRTLLNHCHLQQLATVYNVLLNYRIAWSGQQEAFVIVPVVMCPEEDCFPGLYCSTFLSEPWLSDGRAIVMSSNWGSIQVILTIDVLSGKVSRITPTPSVHSWDILAVDGDDILAVSSSPIDSPQIKYGRFISQKDETVASTAWNWMDVSSPSSSYPEKTLELAFGNVKSLLSALDCSIMKIPVRDGSENQTKGAGKPFEAIFVSHSPSLSNDSKGLHPLIVMLHGGPHSVTSTSYSKSLAYLTCLGYNLLMDVNDVLSAIDHVVEKGLADPSKIAVLGGSHGGFLTTHLIGQAPERFAAAAVRNPVCNLALMVGTTDIPDWCYVESYSSEARSFFTEAPSVDHLHLFHSKSPISHISKVKTPALFLLGAQDLRVPVSNGLQKNRIGDRKIDLAEVGLIKLLQYARALKERGVEVKVIVFPNDVHGIERFDCFLHQNVAFLYPQTNSTSIATLALQKQLLSSWTPQSDFECFLNIGGGKRPYVKPLVSNAKRGQYVGEQISTAV